MWTLKYKPTAEKSLDRLDKPIKAKIVKYLKTKVLKNPRQLGRALTANFSGYWRYRVGDYRIICEIKDKELIVFVVDLGHRGEIYDK